MVNTQYLCAKIKTRLKHKIKQDEIEEILDHAVDIILDSTANGEDVNINGLGKFYSRFIKGKNLRSNIAWLKNKEYVVPNRYKLGFKPSKRAAREVSKLSAKLEQKTEE